MSIVCYFYDTVSINSFIQFILYKIYPAAWVAGQYGESTAAIVLLYVDVAIVMKSMGARVLMN